MSKTKRRIFFDMDGVLAVFHAEKSIEEISVPGYFKNLETMPEVVKAVKQIVKNSDYEVYILSSVLNDTAKQEKIEWLSINLPEISTDKMIFPAYGESKAESVRQATTLLATDDILVDDFTFNLKSWHGVGVKLLNRINNTNRSWNGFIVNGNATADIIALSIQGIANAA